MVIRPRKHQRNRQPRPQQVVSPPAPIVIVKAECANGANVSVRLTLSGVAAVQWGICTTFDDFTEPAASTLINPITTNQRQVEVVFANAINRVGHVVGWDAPPPELVALGLNVAPASTAVCVAL